MSNLKLKVLVIGNPFDGMTVYGPIADPDRIDGDDIQDDWWIVDLEPAPDNTGLYHPDVVELMKREIWGQHPDYPRGDWAYEATNGDTNLGYWEWVTGQIEQDYEPEEPGTGMQEG